MNTEEKQKFKDKLKRRSKDGKAVSFEPENHVDPRTGKEWLRLKAKKEGSKFVVRRDIVVDRELGDTELGIIVADMQRLLDLADEYAKIGTLAPLCEVEEDEA